MKTTQRRAWIDVETGGLNCKINPILQIAIIIEDLDGKKLGSFQTYVQPSTYSVIEDDALAINGITREMISKAPLEKKAFGDMITFLKKHKLGTKQYEFCGYNSRFDMDFVAEFFDRNHHRFWSYFNYYDIDAFALVKILGITGTRFDEKKRANVPCKKLECICKMFGIKLDAHDALEDINATRKLFKKLTKKYLK